MISVFIPLFVCLSARESQKKTPVKFSSIFLHTLSVAVARSYSDSSAIRYVLPVLCMTSCFHIIEQTGIIRDDAYASSSSQGGGTGAKSSVSDKILFAVDYVDYEQLCKCLVLDNQ